MVQKTIRVALKQEINSIKKKIERRAAKIIAPNLKKYIAESIARGNSPVEGFGRFDDYSDVYKNAIKGKGMKKYNKKERPINLKLSGKMLKKLSTKPKANKIVVKIDSKIADYHNKQGAGKSKTIRRILPFRDEEFSSQILRKVRKEFLRIFNTTR